MNKYLRMLALTLVVFSGMGFRLLQFEGAIIVYFVLLCLINLNLILTIRPKLLLLCLCVLLLLVLLYLIKEVIFPAYMSVVIFGGYVFLLPYLNNSELLGSDIVSFCKLGMFYTITSIPIPLFFSSTLSDTLLDYSLYKTFLYIYWFSPIGGLELFNGLRHAGITWEPGIWQIFLNLNLLFALHEKRSNSHIILSLISIFVIYSTTGMFVAALLLFFYAFLKSKNIKFSQIIFTIMPILAFSPYIFQNITEKLYGEHMGSGMTRFSDFFTGFYLLFQNPFFGTAYDNAIASVNLDLIAIKTFFWSGNFVDGAYDAYLTVSNSNGYIIFLLDWGLPIGLILLYFVFTLNLYSDKRVNFMFMMILFVSISSEAITNTTFFYALVILSCYKFFRKLSFV